MTEAHTALETHGAEETHADDGVHTDDDVHAEDETPAGKAAAAERVQAATDVLNREGLLKPGQYVTKADDHEVRIRDDSRTLIPGTATAALTTRPALSTSAVAGNGYNLSFGPGLLDSYQVRSLPGTPRWVVDKVLAAGAAAEPYTGSRYVPGTDTTSNAPAEGEVLVGVSDITPCSANPGLLGCAVTWYSSYVVSAIIYATSTTLNYARSQCVMNHEVGHALGLSHVNDSTQLMYPYDQNACDYQNGDRAGLTAMGGKLFGTGTPVGSLDSATVQASAGNVRLAGWAADPDTPTSPIQISVTVGPKFSTTTANIARNDVGLSYPQYGSAHGFDVTVTDIPSGTHSACATAINVNRGYDMALGCRDVIVPSGPPATPAVPTLEAGLDFVTVQAAAAPPAGVKFIASVFDTTGSAISGCEILSGITCTIPALGPGPYRAILEAANSYGRSAPTSQSTPVTVGATATFTPVTPTRILDSRNGTGTQRYSSPWLAGTERAVTVTGTFGAITVPADATAVVVNLTATDTTGWSYATVWPSGSTRPTVSSLNWGSGETVANHVTVPVGSSGRISVFNKAGQAHFVIDIVGYHRAGGTGSAYTSAVTPTRILDSRNGTGTERYGTLWGAGTERTVTVTGTFGAVTVPADATAVIVNLTATDTTGWSYAAVWPYGSTRPTVSSLNWPAGDTRANLVTVPVGAGGKISVYNNGGQASLIMDIVGWYTPSSSSKLRSVQPTRVVDTRIGLGTTAQALGAGECRALRVTGRVGSGTELAWIPAAAVSVTLNVTVTDTTGWSYLTVYPTGGAKPLASTQNWGPGATRPAAVEAGIGTNGSVTVCNLRGLASVIVDVSGYRIAS